MKFLTVIFFLIVTIMASCTKDSKDNSAVIPDYVINKPTMVSIVVDLSLLESARGMNLLSKNDSVNAIILGPDIPKYQEIIFAKYGVNKVQYDSSFAFYSQNPKLLMEIFDEAINQLSQTQAKVNR